MPGYWRPPAATPRASSQSFRQHLVKAHIAQSGTLAWCLFNLLAEQVVTTWITPDSQKEFVGLRSTTVRDVNKYDPNLWLADIPKNPTLRAGHGDEGCCPVRPSLPSSTHTCNAGDQHSCLIDIRRPWMETAPHSHYSQTSAVFG
jgi:hypothetical protein